MANYYYDKYTAPISSWNQGYQKVADLIASAVSTSGPYSFNSLTNVYTPGGASYYNNWNCTTQPNFDGYQDSGNGGIYYIHVKCPYDDYRWDRWLYHPSYSTPNYIQGSLIQSNIIAPDGTYPANGVSGGYWYVKKGLAFPQLKADINGVVKTTIDGWADINGVLRKITDGWACVNGVLKKL